VTVCDVRPPSRPHVAVRAAAGAPSVIESDLAPWRRGRDATRAEVTPEVLAELRAKQQTTMCP
jgi:hypothetical protein